MKKQNKEEENETRAAIHASQYKVTNQSTA